MEQQKFKKVMNAGDVLVMAFGAMIGWGWVVSSGKWIQSAGVLGTIIGFVIGGVMIYFVGLAYAELTAAMPQCGGEHIFSYKAFGTIGSFICTWAIILSYIGVVCFEACSLPTIIQYVFPGFLKGYLYTVAGFDIYATWVLAAVVSSILITLINIRGVKAAAILQTILTASIAIVGIFLVAASMINGSPSNLEEQIVVGEGIIGSIKNVLSVAIVAPFFLFGFDVIPQTAEEINIPLKKIGRILLFSIICAVAFYALVVFAVGYAMDIQEITVSSAETGLVTADAMAKVFKNKAMAKVLLIGGMCGIITSWNSFLIGGSRAIYSMAEFYMIPHMFARLHPRYQTPVNALILVGGLSVISPFFGRSMLVWISDTASFACCLAYCMVALSFIVLRKKEPAMKRPYEIRHYKLVGILAVVMSGIMVVMYLLPGSGYTLLAQEWGIAVGWALLGICFFIVSKRKYKNKFGRNEDAKIMDTYASQGDRNG